MIRIKDLSFKYEKEYLFKNFSLHIPPGESCLITGINGVGKSTLLRIMAGVLLPDRGKVTYNPSLGNNPQTKIGFISDKLSFYESLKVPDAIRLHQSIYKIKEFDQHLIQHTKIKESQRIKELSVGQKTIFLLSLMLSIKPEVLLIDEIIHSLDAYLRKLFLDQIITLLARRNITLVMVNVNFHDIEHLVNRVILLKNGEIAVDENIEDLKQKVKKINADAYPDNLPVIARLGDPYNPDLFIYPYQMEFKNQIRGDVVDLNLTEIVAAFIGGEYA